MADTSLNENRLGLLIWQTSNVWQARLRFLLKDYNLSLNELVLLVLVGVFLIFSMNSVVQLSRKFIRK